MEIKSYCNHIRKQKMLITNNYSNNNNHNNSNISNKISTLDSIFTKAIKRVN